jgi:hypothetical protein
MAYALGKPLQRFLEPLDCVAISPGWVVGVLLSLLAAYGFEKVTLRAQNFQSDEAVAKRARNPKLSWIFRVLPWKINEATLGLFSIPSVVLLIYPPLRRSVPPSVLSMVAPLSTAALPLFVLWLSGYYLSHPGPRVPKSPSVRKLVILLPALLTFSFTSGFFRNGLQTRADNLIQVSLKEQTQPVDGELLFTLNRGVLLRNSVEDVVLIPWEKVLSVSMGEKKP